MNFLSRPFLSVVLAAAAGATVTAQDLRTVQPQPAPPMPAAPGPADAEPAALPPAPKTADSGLAPVARLRLNGIVLLAEPAQLKPDGWPAEALPSSKLDTTRLPFLPPAAAETVLRPGLGQALTPDFLRALPAAVGGLCRQAGRAFVSVTIPPQDFSTGVLQVLVVEGRLGAVRVEGARYFSEDSYRAALGAKPGGTIDAARLDADLAGLAQNPFRSATVTAAPGATAGTTDLRLTAQDRLPWRFYGGYDDTGNRTTGLERVNAGINWGNAFGLGHQVNYQLTASPDFNRSVSHSFNYVAPMPWNVGHTLTASYSYGRIRPDMAPPFDQEGHSQNAGLRYRWPLPRLGALDHALVAGVDFKSSDNNLLFSNTPVSGNTTHVWEASAGWEATLADRLGTTQFSATVYGSPGDLDDRNTDAAFDVSRAGAKARYTYVQLNLTRSTPLPQGWLLLTTLNAQLASGNLLGSEQFTLGGAYTVRGYDDGAYYGDQGVLLRNELRLPALRGLSRWAGGKMPADTFTPLVFTDWGISGPRNPLPGEDKSVVLGSAGVGFRYQWSKYGTVSADYGWQLRDENLGGESSGRIHLSASLSW